MSPLQALILGQMAAKGWEPKDVEARGVSHATLFRYMNPVHLKSAPRESTMRALADALDVPFSKVKAASYASVGRVYGTQVAASQVFLGALEEMDEEERQAEVAALLADLRARGVIPDEPTP